MNKVQYFELPTNIRIAFMFVCLGIASLALYSLGVGLGAHRDLVDPDEVSIEFGLYVIALIQLKRRNLISYSVAMAILGPLSFYNLYEISQLYSKHMEQAILYVWLPLTHFSIFSLCFLLSATPKTIEFYRGHD